MTSIVFVVMAFMEVPMHVVCYRDSDLSSTQRQRIARYRHRVFVEMLGWPLPANREGSEQDEFDTAPSLHVIATDDDARIVGYARLRPTTEPYLLAVHFASLLNGHSAPCDPHTWEISRYAAINLVDPASGCHTDVGKAVLRAAIVQARARGAERLVCCTSVAIERVALRWGFRMQRLGPPARHAADLIVAAGIEFDARTLEALAPKTKAFLDPFHSEAVPTASAAQPAEELAVRRLPQRQAAATFPITA
ncbi:MAG TPA: acyl-homoserine-lactone synthase [Ideonella sp.]|uniref:acyl-homoserine-lactone synthase n=1 Tax=Ideonella sp. TaxID=1929293 RepID=UPI002B836D45|nr:acyl-homoserine-lactone synthase [Ideonella sp.]HSI50343.1 acyl-homoserine-lactone synthase [Ideonella sp.]